MANWKTMEPAKTLPLHKTRKNELVRWGKQQGFSDTQIQASIESAAAAETYMNDNYVATLHPVETQDGWPKMVQLSIRRVDRKPIHDWRHLQQIKNDIFSPLHEAVELYPMADRVVDTANSYHLFVLTVEGLQFPFGWPSGLRSDDSAADIPNQQRPGSLSGA